MALRQKCQAFVLLISWLWWRTYSQSYRGRPQVVSTEESGDGESENSVLLLLLSNYLVTRRAYIPQLESFQNPNSILLCVSCRNETFRADLDENKSFKEVCFCFSVPGTIRTALYYYYYYYFVVLVFVSSTARFSELGCIWFRGENMKHTEASTTSCLITWQMAASQCGRASGDIIRCEIIKHLSLLSGVFTVCGAADNKLGG